MLNTRVMNTFMPIGGRVFVRNSCYRENLFGERWQTPFLRAHISSLGE